jgi:hypothetical protein
MKRVPGASFRAEIELQRAAAGRTFEGSQLFDVSAACNDLGAGSHELPDRGGADATARPGH